MSAPELPAVPQGLLDTSVVTDLEQVVPGSLPIEPTIAAVTLAELTAGPHASDDVAERARRQDRLQRFEALLDPLPFDAAAARAYGRVYAATRDHVGAAGGARAVDLMVAATALANDLPLFTRHPGDVDHLRAIGLEVHAV